MKNCAARINFLCSKGGWRPWDAGGVPEETIERLFEPYFTTKGPKGTGIGLYISKIIIEKNMGGRLCVHNVKGGAEFRIEV